MSPLVLFWIFLFVVGIGSAVVQSLGAGIPGVKIAASGDLFAAYQAMAASPGFLASVYHTLTVSLVAAVISTVIGTTFAYLVWRSPPHVSALVQVYRVPIILPHIVVAFLVLLILGQRGVLSGLLAALSGNGATDAQFPDLIYNRWGSGMIVAYVYKEFPFVVLLVLGALQQVPSRYVTTARQLGSGELRTFLLVIVPQVASTIVQAFAIVFLYGFGAFEIPYLLGSSNPQMIPIFVFNTYFHRPLADRPMAMAVLVTMTAVVVILGSILVWVGNRSRRWKRSEL